MDLVENKPPTLTLISANRTVNINPTFLTFLKCNISKLKPDEKQEISTDHFLDHVFELFTILDMFGGTVVFEPIKKDVHGNINKLRMALLKDPITNTSLQSMVKKELTEKTHQLKNSSTDALMWLMRGLDFLREFFIELSKDIANPNIKKCVLDAYDRTLRKHHTWIIVKMFLWSADYMLPTRKDFYKGMTIDNDNLNEDEFFKSNEQFFRNDVFNSLILTIKSIDMLVDLIKKFYRDNKLEL